MCARPSGKKRKCAYFQVDGWLFFLKSNPCGFSNGHCWGTPSLPVAFLIYYDLIISVCQLTQPAPCPKCRNALVTELVLTDLMFLSCVPFNHSFSRLTWLFSLLFFCTPTSRMQRTRQRTTCGEWKYSNNMSSGLAGRGRGGGGKGAGLDEFPSSSSACRPEQACEVP